MKVLKRIFIVVVMVTMLSVTTLTQMTAFGQKSNENRPPKEKPIIKEKDKNPPPSNSNSNKRGKP